MAPEAPPRAVIADEVRRALAEDLGGGDLTAGLLPAGATLDSRVVCRERAVFCGAPWFRQTFAQLDPGVRIEWAISDGDRLQPDQTVCRVHGPAAPLLSGERTALNFIQALSGTATATRRYARALEGTNTRLLDTRKTLPGLRRAQKYAVRCGGGDNHRMGLFDAMMLKENHLSAAGGIGPAVEAARHRHPDRPLIVEVESLDELRQALDAGAPHALLDNFTLEDLHEAVALAAGRARLEASGNVTLDSIGPIAATGVDYVSVGAITKHVRAVDFSLRFVD